MKPALVVALVAAAGLTLQARQGLDWGELADPAQVRWARVVAGTVLLLLLAAIARHLWVRMRRPAPRPGGRARPPDEPLPLLLRVLAVLLILAALAVAWYVASSVSGPVQAVDPPSASAPPSGAPADTSAEPGPSWPTLIAVGALLLAVAVAARLRGVRRGGGHQQASDPDDERPVAAELSSAVAAAEVQLALHGDARAAIVAAYTAMAEQIGSGLTGSGRPVSAADTPTELLDRATAAGLVGGDAAGTLTGLFREARFSRHPMGEPARRAAEQALAQVRDELAARRA